MDYVFRFLFGFAVTFIGCELAILITRRGIRKNARMLEELKSNLTKPESYIWVNVEDRLPVHNRDYLVEYYFEVNPNLRYHSVHEFQIREHRFEYDGFHGLKVVRWAELPR